MATAKKTSATKKTSAKGAAKASGKRAATTGGRTLTVRGVPPKARVLKIGVGIEKAFKLSGCPGCRSGIDRIVFEDPIVNPK